MSPVNVFHCCVHKTASQWVRHIVSDPRVIEYSGLQPFNHEDQMPSGFDPRDLNQRMFDQPFPEHTFVTPLYIDFQGFASIPKTSSYKAFFVMRDPRDIVVSWYFSNKFSHVAYDSNLGERHVLATVSLQEGLIHSIQRLKENGLFESLRSWFDAAKHDDNVWVTKFEELTSPENYDVFDTLFQHCQIDVPEAVLRQVLEDVKFENLAGRQRGEENVWSHFRKGIGGDWVNYFDDEVEQQFTDISGDLARYLGYESNHIGCVKSASAQTPNSAPKSQSNLPLAHQTIDSSQSLQATIQILNQHVDHLNHELNVTQLKLEHMQAFAKQAELDKAHYLQTINTLRTRLKKKTQRVKNLNIQLKTIRRQHNKVNQMIKQREAGQSRRLNHRFSKLKNFLLNLNKGQ